VRDHGKVHDPYEEGGGSIKKYVWAKVTHQKGKEVTDHAWGELSKGKKRAKS